jgi:hypothetical protein
MTEAQQLFENFLHDVCDVPLSESATIPAGTAQWFEKHRHERQS